jgi:hypothetical protein
MTDVWGMDFWPNNWCKRCHEYLRKNETLVLRKKVFLIFANERKGILDFKITVRLVPLHVSLRRTASYQWKKICQHRSTGKNVIAPESSHSFIGLASIAQVGSEDDGLPINT